MASGIALAPLICDIKANLSNYNKGVDEASKKGSELEKQFKELNAESKLSESTFRLAGAQAELLGKKTGSLAVKQNELTEKLKLQSKSVELNKAALDNAEKSLNNYSNKNKELEKTIKDLSKEQEVAKRTFGANSKQAKELENKLNSLNKEYKENGTSIDKATDELNEYKIKLNDAQTELLQTKKSLKDTNKEIKKTKIDNINKHLDKISNGLKNTGTALTTHVTVPLAAAGVASFKLASDLNENINKTEVVFKNNTQTVLEWSKTSLKSMGMCQSSALEMASKFGDMGSSMGLSSKQTKDYSMNLTQLSADLASFKNISIDRANEALTGVYTGETEALKGLGIVMTQTNLQQFASNRGIKKKIQNMSQAEQVQLRYNYVMAKTKDAQGDFARTGDQAANATRSFWESTKELGATIGKKLLPMITPLINKANEAIKSFAEMDEGTRNLIVKFGLFAIATGPVMNVAGKGIGLLTKITPLIVGASTATAGAGVAAGGLATALTGVALPIVGIVAGIGTIGYAAYKASEKLNESATPAVDLFANKTVDATKKIKDGNKEVQAIVGKTTVKISEATKEAVNSYLKLDEKASGSLMDLRVNSDKFTETTKNKVIKNFTDMSKKASNLSKEQKENITIDFKRLVSDTGTLTEKNKDEIIKSYSSMVNGTKNLSKKQKEQIIKDFSETLNKSTSITKKQSSSLQKLYKDMGDKIKTGLDKKKNEQIKSLKDFFNKSNALTAKEEANTLKKTKESWDKKKKTVNNMQKQINDIIKKASDEHRQISNQEAKEISDIQRKMKNQAIKTLSDNEVQSKVILERIKDQDGHITAEQASTHIKELNKLRDKSVKAANEECDKRIAEIIRMRDESKSISKDQADKLISEAKRQRDGTINAANETRNRAVEKITSMNSTIKDSVNTTTGDVLSNWQKFADWWNSWWPQPKTLTVKETGNSPNPFARRVYGHKYNGMDYVPYDGYLARLHKGERVLTADENANYNKGNGDIKVTNNFYVRENSPYEVYKATRNSMKDWKFT